MPMTRVSALAAVLASLVFAQATTATTSPSCPAPHPTVAYRAGTGDAAPEAIRHVRTPVVCGASTGYPTSETTLAITNAGTIFFSPAGSENSLARSTDHGIRWQLVTPPDMQLTSLWNTDDPQVVVDRTTGRLFWVHTTHLVDLRWPFGNQSAAAWLVPTAVADAHGFQVYSTADDGLHWHTADDKNENTADWEKLFLGPPPGLATGAPQPTGYPNIVYVCANAPQEVLGPGRVCYRSLDGGLTFSFAGQVFPSATAPVACPPLAANTGVVASDGTVYIPQSCAAGTYLAVSRDEGASYSWLPVSGAPPTSGLGATVQLAIDSGDDLYLLWTAADTLQLVRSTDGGRSWTPPLTISEPGLHNITLPALAAGPRGTVGVAYYASTDPSAKQLSAYISETMTALRARPVFYAGPANDPASPIYQNYGDADSPRPDFVGAAYDNAGTLWAAMVKQLGSPNAANEIATSGYVGRLAFRAKAPRLKPGRRRPKRAWRRGSHRRPSPRASRPGRHPSFTG